MTLVSFVIPTLNRASLESALKSLESQSDSDWIASVGGDGVFPTVFFDTDKISSFTTMPRGSAGLTRNAIIRWSQSACDKPRWIAFLDDDDEVSPLYVEHLRLHDEQEKPDVVIFRMSDPELGILPSPDRPMIISGGVGISFAVRSKWLCGPKYHAFIQEDTSIYNHEDIAMLESLKKDKAKIYMSPYVDYFVGAPKEGLVSA